MALELSAEKKSFIYTTPSETGSVTDISLVPSECTKLSISHFDSDLNLKEFKSLKLLSILEFKGEKIVGCPYLESLELRFCPELKSLPVAKQLKNLICEQCDLITEIAKFSYLEYLEVSSKNLTAIYSLPELLLLDISKCDNPNINDCENVIEFKCNNSGIKLIPTFPKLKYLECNDCNNLKNIPILKELDFLSCKNNFQIEEIPEALQSLKELNCSGSGVTYLPIFKNLVYLTCKNCYIQIIKSMPNLKFLKCSESAVQVIYEQPKLISLVCSDCKDLNEIESIDNIEDFTCENCYDLEALPILRNKVTIGNCPKLKIINLTELNSLKCILCEELTTIYINNSEVVESIDCSDCEKLILISSDTNLEKIFYEIKLDGCFNVFFTKNLKINNKKIIEDLSQIPTDCVYLYSFRYNGEPISFSKFHNLKILTLDTFNSGIIDLGNVNYVNITDCKIKLLPHSDTLEILDCYSSSLQEVTGFLNLKTLTLDDSNNLKQISFLPKLENLFIQNCKNNILIDKCENITKFLCEDSSFSDLPMFPKLKSLVCRNCPITSIPVYKNLEKLECSDLKISSLPELENLWRLVCSNSDIREIPSYKNLKELYCFSCLFLNVIPEYEGLDIFQCSNNNNISSLPLISGEILIKSCSNLEDIVATNVDKFQCDKCDKLSTVFITGTSDIEILSVSNCKNLILIMADATLQTLKESSVTNCSKSFVSEKLRIDGVKSTINGILEYKLNEYIKNV